MIAIPFKGFLRLIQTRLLQGSATPLCPSHPLQSSFTVQYLTKSCGFPLETALSISQNLRLDERKSQKYESVVAFLKSHGFSDAHLVELVTKCPAIFGCRVGTTLQPKFEYLLDSGFVGLLLPSFVLSYPQITRRGLNTHLRPLVDCLKKYLVTNEKVLDVLRRSPWKLQGRMQKNIECFLKEGMTMENVGKLLLKQPRLFLENSDRMASLVGTIKKSGKHAQSPMFSETLLVMASMSDSTRERKLEFFKSLGCSEDDILTATMKFPKCLAWSEEKVKRAMDFYVNSMKMEPKQVIRRPVLLGFSINKRVIPRYSLFKFLKTVGALKMNKKFVSALFKTEDTFMKMYVHKNEKRFPDLIEFYSTLKKAGMLGLTS